MQSPSHWKKTRNAALATAFTLAGGYSHATSIVPTTLENSPMWAGFPKTGPKFNSQLF
ncbi:MAG: hypothetical protein IPG23_25305 [Burkholderiales bacterium]|nr:hypothetical protein [Burkholderiales bacterium]